jgi:hypothetical protein
LVTESCLEILLTVLVSKARWFADIFDANRSSGKTSAVFVLTTLVTFPVIALLGWIREYLTN